MASATLRPAAQHAVASQRRARPARDSFARRNALGIAPYAIFGVLLVAMTLTGHGAYNAELLEHGGGTYLGEGHFWEALFENWESEFLAVFSIVVPTIFLRQRGSAESKPVAAPHDATGTAA